MKKLAMALLSMLMVACFAAVALAEGTRGTSALTIKGKTVSVEYGRPSLKGRTTDELLGKLKAGGVWRLGADTATSLKTALDLTFGDLTVPAGEYSLFMQRQDDNSWKLVFNKQHGQWGTEHDASQDLGSVPLKESKAGKSVETLTLTLHKASGGGTLSVEWGTLEVRASFKAK
jgi:hypothetical protein